MYTVSIIRSLGSFLYYLHIIKYGNLSLKFINLMSQNGDQSKKKDEEFSFSYYYGQPQKKKEEKKVQPPTPSPAPQPVTQAQTTPGQAEKAKKQTRSPEDEFYLTILKHQEHLPKEQVKIYKKNMETYLSRWGLSDFLLMGSVFIVLSGYQTKWWRLTTKPQYWIPKLALMYIIPNNYFSNKMSKQNYEFYRRNMTSLEPILTKEERAQMKLAQLLQKYQ